MSNGVFHNLDDSEEWWRLKPGFHTETEVCNGHCGDPWAHKLFSIFCSYCGESYIVKRPILNPWLCEEEKCESNRLKETTK